MSAAWLRQDAVRGVLWVLEATFVFSLIFASGKLAGGTVPALQIVFIRYLSGFVTVLAVTPMRGGLRALASPQRHLHGLRALCGVGAGICLIYAPMHMPMADAAAIGLTEGMMVVVLAALVLGERVGVKHWLAALVCAVGALIVVRGRGTAEMAAEMAAADAFPAAIAFAGALLIACERILIKMLSSRDRAVAMLAHVNGIATLLLAVPALWWWQPVPAGTLAWLLLLGPLAIAGQYCNIRGFRLASASLLGPIGYSWIVFSGIIGLTVFGEWPGASTLLGASLIVAGGIVLTRLHTSARRPAQTASRVPARDPAR
ncbi:MAG TPA: DMT family transporter [Arenibaculum sp.]|nr:DMT family transporter [Arenibaculum sp.]